jgi:hypothetical protein
MAYRATRRRRAIEARRWRPQSIADDPAWNRKLVNCRAMMRHFDRLPAPIRQALAGANVPFSAEQVAMMWMTLPMSYDAKVAYILAAIKANDV